MTLLSNEAFDRAQSLIDLDQLKKDIIQLHDDGFELEEISLYYRNQVYKISEQILNGSI